MKSIIQPLLVYGMLLLPILSVSAQDKQTIDGGVKINIAPAEDKQLAETASMLAGYIQEMTGSAKQDVSITLALTGHIVRKNPTADKLGDMNTGAYAIVKTDPNQLLIAGNSVKAVTDGVYDFLGELGCRWLTPGKNWRIIPKISQLKLPEIDRATQPAFLSRTIFYAYGVGGDDLSKDMAATYQEWSKANRMGSVFTYRCGHAYPSTLGRFAKEFETHPEYFAMKKDGTRFPFGKFNSICYSNPDVAALFIKDKLDELEANTKKDPADIMVSMDPNDGSTECFCENCKKLGNGTDQALHLANQVADALAAKNPKALVGLYAYASHRMPPEKIEARPNICVQQAMGFNKTGLSYKELLDRWSKKVKQIGIRDYLGVMAWDWGLPGRGKGASMSYIKEKIPAYHNWGAITYNSEINANWGSFGAPVYVATRLLWDPKADAEAAYSDFLSHAYGPAAGEMRKLYSAWSENQSLTRTNLHEWLDLMNAAWEKGKNSDPGVKSRLADMMAYIHYAVLFRKWELAEDSRDRAKAYEALRPLLTFTWQTRDRQMVHAYALQRRLVNSGAPVLKPLDPEWRFNEPKAVWKADGLLTDEQVIELFKKDIADYPADDRIKSFSGELVPLPPEIAVTCFTPKQLTPELTAQILSKTTPAVGSVRGRSVWHFLIRPEDSRDFEVTLTGAQGEYTLEIFDNSGKSIFDGQEDVEANTKDKTVAFKVNVPQNGLYTAAVNAPGDYQCKFSGSMPCVIEVSHKNSPHFRQFGQAYFFVPKGTKELLLLTDTRLSISPPAPSGARKDYSPADFGSRECIQIPAGEDAGKVWKMINQTSGKTLFFNIPPYVAEHPSRLLVPKTCLGEANAK